MIRDIKVADNLDLASNIRAAFAGIDYFCKKIIYDVVCQPDGI